MRRGGVLICLLAGISSGQQNTVIRTETRVVLVDVIVTGRNGRYIRDLTQKDFHVWQDNKEQTIASFALESSAAAPQPRSLVLFFDNSSMEARDQIPARRAAANFIDAETGPNRKMAVVTYDGQLKIGQNFTDNAGRLKDSLPAPTSRVTEERPGRSSLNNTVPQGGAVDDTGARNMLRSLRDLGRSLGVLPGRKIIVLFAGKIASSSQQRSDLNDVIQTCNESGVAVYPVDVRPVFMDTTAENSSVNVFPDNPRARGRTAGPQGDSDDTRIGVADTGSTTQLMLADLARRTGGLVIGNSNDLLGGLQEVAAEQDQYYALTYVPPESKEGSCHALKVKVDRGGTTVRARNSYCATKPMDLLAGTTMGKDLEKRAAEGKSGNISASLELPYFYTGPHVARVDVAMELTPGALKFENRKGRLHAEINLLGIASNQDGEVRARFSDTLKFDFDNEAQISNWKTAPVHYAKEFRIASGEYTFTMAFGDASQSNESFGKIQVPLVIGPWTGAELALSGLVLSRETRPAADVGLSLSLGGQTPLIAGSTQVVPSGSGSFARTDTAFFYFEVYDPDPPSVTVRVRALDRKTGGTKWDSGFSKLPLPSNGGKPSIPAMARLPFDSLGPGLWTLEVAASDSAGKTVTRTGDFEVR